MDYVTKAIELLEEAWRRGELQLDVQDSVLEDQASALEDHPSKPEDQPGKPESQACVQLPLWTMDKVA